MNKKNNGKIKENREKEKNPVKENNFIVFPSKTDPQGSYTGVPADRYEKPVQDVDDL